MTLAKLYLDCWVFFGLLSPLADCFVGENPSADPSPALMSCIFPIQLKEISFPGSPIFMAFIPRVKVTCFYNKSVHKWVTTMLNNNNKAKTKQQTQEQLPSPLSQVLKTYDFGNFEIVS